MQLVVTNNKHKVPTMSSKDIAAYTGKEHKNVIRDIREMFVKLDGSKLIHEYNQGLSDVFYSENFDLRNYTESFDLDEELTLTLVSGYDVTLRKGIIKAWKAAEKALANSQPVALLPNFEDPVEAAIAWAEQYKIAREAKEQIAIDAPLVEAFKQISCDESTTMKLADCAKILDMKPRKFNSWLRANCYLQENNVAYQSKIVQGLFVLKYPYTSGKDGVEYKPTTLVTSKGVTYFQKKLDKGE